MFYKQKNLKSIEYKIINNIIIISEYLVEEKNEIAADFAKGNITRAL